MMKAHWKYNYPYSSELDNFSHFSKSYLNLQLIMGNILHINSMTPLDVRQHSKITKNKAYLYPGRKSDSSSMSVAKCG